MSVQIQNATGVLIPFLWSFTDTHLRVLLLLLFVLYVCVCVYWVCIMHVLYVFKCGIWVCVSVLCMYFLCSSVVSECGCRPMHTFVFREARRGLQCPALSHLPCSFETGSLSEPGTRLFTRVLETKHFYGCEVYAVILDTKPSLLPHIWALMVMELLVCQIFNSYDRMLSEHTLLLIYLHTYNSGTNWF